MEKKILCVMAGYDNDTERYLAALQNRLYEKGFLGTHTRNLPQHITLATFPVEKESELVDLVTQASHEIKPFAITFNHIGLFGGSKCLFVAPDPNDGLFRLQERFGKSHNWTPHTTMLIDEPEVVFAALPFLAEDFRAFHGLVQNIHLYEFWPTRHILSLTFE